MRYTILKNALALPRLAGRAFDPEAEPFCRAVPYAPIASYAWDETGYRPEARAWLTEDETGFNALLAAREETVCANATEWNGQVWLDSCLECFLSPVEGDPRYMNVEVNAAGAGLIGLGEERANRTCLSAPPKDLELEVSRHEGGWWAVRYRLRFSLLESLFGAEPTRVMRANFYACDESLHPHFGAWSPIDAPRPDFHRPECFGALEREDVSQGGKRDVY